LAPAFLRVFFVFGSHFPTLPSLPPSLLLLDIHLFPAPPSSATLSFSGPRQACRSRPVLVPFSFFLPWSDPVQQVDFLFSFDGRGSSTIAFLGCLVMFYVGSLCVAALLCQLSPRTVSIFLFEYHIPPLFTTRFFFGDDLINFPGSLWLDFPTSRQIQRTCG